MSIPIVDSEFASLIPPLTPDELAGLETSILAEGCRDALVVWSQGNVLLDGHNRFRICQEHSLPFKTTAIDLPDRDAAADWIDASALGRRNLTPSQASYLRGRRYNRTKKAHGGDRKSSGQSVLLMPTAESIAKESGVDERTVRRDGKRAEALDLLAQTAPVEAQAVKNGSKGYVEVFRKLREDNREAARQENAARIAKIADPVKAGLKFTTLLLDPPWDWGDEGDVNQLGRAKPDYATMSLDQLLRLPVAELADRDAHLYLWITNRSLPKGFALLDRWGFRYITALTWPKPSYGMGNYFRGQTEHILFGVRGSLPLKRKDVGTLLPAWKRGPDGHSSKPVEIHEFIESCSPGPYIELFARRKRDGWIAWGENG